MTIQFDDKRQGGRFGESNTTREISGDTYHEGLYEENGKLLFLSVEKNGIIELDVDEWGRIVDAAGRTQEYVNGEWREMELSR